MKNAAAPFIALLALGAPLFAAFEDIGAGARPIGMGSAFTAVADDANTVYYNPAGLGQLKHPQFTAGYGRLSMGLSDDSNLGSGFLAATMPLKGKLKGTLGFDILNLQLSGAYSEDTISFAYGREIRSGLSAGAALKVLRRYYNADAYTAIDPLFQANGRSADGISLDVGALYRRSKHYVFALSLKDVNQPDLGLGEKDQVPMTIKTGFAYYQRALVLSGELQRRDGDNGLAIGAERWIMRHRAAVRGGFDFGAGSRRNMSFGSSIRFGNGQVDYAILFPLAGVTDTAGSHRLAFTMRFGRSDAGSVALLEQEELLGPDGTNSEQVAEMREELERVRQDSERDTQLMQERVQQLEKQLAELRAAPPVAEAPEAPAPPPAPAPAPEAPAVPAAPPAPVPDDESKMKITTLEQELNELRGELTKRRFAPPAPRSAPRQAPGIASPGTYVVKPGDTLQSIARKAWGDPNRWTDLYQANKERIKRGGSVTPGQLLIIP